MISRVKLACLSSDTMLSIEEHSQNLEERRKEERERENYELVSFITRIIHWLFITAIYGYIYNGLAYVTNYSYISGGFLTNL